MQGKYEYRFFLDCGFAGTDREERFSVQEFGYSEKGWDSLTQEERESILEVNIREWVHNFIDYSWS